MSGGKVVLHLDNALSLPEAVAAQRNASADPATGLTLSQALSLIHKANKVLDLAGQLHLRTRRRSGGPGVRDVLETAVQEALRDYLLPRLVTGFRQGEVTPSDISTEWLEVARFDITANSAEANGTHVTGIRVREPVAPAGLRAFLETGGGAGAGANKGNERTPPASAKFKTADQIRAARLKLGKPRADFESFEHFRRALCDIAGVPHKRRGWGDDTVRRALMNLM